MKPHAPLPPDFIRPLRSRDHEAVDTLLRAAFGGPGEAALVHALRASGAMEAEVVLPCDGDLAGYLAVSRMVAPAGWLALAPVAIAPAWQGRRLGSRMVAGMMRLMGMKGATVVVLGKPSFYERAGFSTLRAARLTSPYPIVNTLIARPGDDGPQEALAYPAAFDAV